MSERDTNEPTIDELEESYNRNNGNAAAVCREFPEQSRYSIYERLKEEGIHETRVRPSDRLKQLDPEDVDALSGGEA